MAISTKGDKYLGKRSKPVIASEGMEITPVSEMNYSQRNEYISDKYVPEVEDASMYFMISGTGFDYDLSGKDKNVKNEILAYYQQQSDYTEESLDSNTNYKVNDWEIVRKDVDPESGEVYEEELEEISADNTYNFGYRGLIDLNWRVYYDEVYEKYFYVIHPHMGGDIRGNYGNALILEGDDKEELFYRFYEEFISGFASVYIKLKDGSELYFDSQNDSDVFYFEFNEYQSKIESDLAQHLVDDFDSFDTWYGDEFLEEIVNLSVVEKDDKKKYVGGGSLDNAPSVYVEILGTDTGKWMDLDGMSNGSEVMDAIQEFINEYNKAKGGNAEEYRIADMEGFGHDYFYNEYMSESDFDDLLEAYNEFENSDFPADLIFEYANDNRMDVIDAIQSMNDNYYGAYSSMRDFAEQMVDEGIYTPSMSDVDITDTDKRLIAGEEADAQLSYMSDWEIIEKANAEDDFYKEQTKLEENISELKEEISTLEAELENSEDDEYDNIADLISEKESDLDDLESDLDSLEENFSDEVKNSAYDELYEEVIYRLENELEDWLNEMGYENVSDASFLNVDYDSIADDLSNDYTIYEVGGKYYFFLMYKGGGKIHSVGKAKDYNYYVIERKSNKIISGHDSKSEANKHKNELKSKNRSLILDVYPRTKVEMEFNIDTTDKKSFVSVDNFKYGGNVKLRSKTNPKSDEETWKTSSEIKSKLSLARAGVDEYEKEDIQSFKKDLSRVRAKNYLKHNTFEMGGMPELLPPDPTPEQRQIVPNRRLLTAHRSMDNIKESVGGRKNWIQKQWEEADFGDGTGRAKFFVKGGGVEFIEYNGKEIMYSPHFEEYYVDDEPFKTLEEAKEYIDKGSPVSNAKKDAYRRGLFKDGGYVFGDKIIFNRKGKQTTGTITDIIDENSYAVFTGSGFGFTQLLVKSNDIIGYHTSPQRKKLFGIFDDGGEIIIENEDERTTLSLNGIGSIVITETTPKYEFVDDISEDELENLDLYEDDFISKIEDLRINDGYKGKGYAKLLMNKALDYIDENYSYPIYLNASPMQSDGMLNLNDLTRFYEKFGFKVFKRQGNNNLMIKKSKGGSTYAEGGSIEKQNKAMLENDAVQIEHHSEELSEVVPKTKKVPAWVIGKTSRINSDLSDVTHYLDGKVKKKKRFELGGGLYDYLFYEPIQYDGGGGVNTLQVNDVVTFFVDNQKTIRPIIEIKDNNLYVVQLSKNEVITIKGEDVIEVKRKETPYDIITKKIGLPEDVANYLVNRSEKYAVWLADSIKKLEIEQTKDMLLGDGEETTNKTEEDWLKTAKELNTLGSYTRFRNKYDNSITEIIDWLEHPLTPNQNLRSMSFNDAIQNSRHWHEQLEAKGGDINYVEPEENILIKEYPKDQNGVTYYWVKIPSSFCQLESSRMGHCGRTRHESLISLRSRTPLKDDNYMSDSHVTIAFGNDGVFYQVKGKKNQKPSEKYFPYIYDLITTIITGEEEQEELIAKKIAEESLPIQEKIRQIEKEIEKIDNEISEKGESWSMEQLESKLNAKMILENQIHYNSPLLRKLEEVGIKYTNAKVSFNGFGSEYGADQDYGFDDMSIEQIRDLLKLKPDLITDAKQIISLYEKGALTKEEIQERIDNSENDEFEKISNRLKLYDAGLIDQRPNTIIKVRAGADDLEKYFNTDLSSDTIYNMITGEDTYSSFDGSWDYYYEDAHNFVDELNKENQQDIIDYMIENSDLTAEDIEENGIDYYLEIDDYQDEFDNIKRSIANSLVASEEGAMLSYYYEQIKDALEEIGEVVSLNDEGLVMNVDLDNSIDWNDEYIQETLERCDDDLDCLFEEELGNSIEIPKLRIDDRYSDRGSLNDYWDGVNEY